MPIRLYLSDGRVLVVEHLPIPLLQLRGRHQPLPVLDRRLIRVQHDHPQLLRVFVEAVLACALQTWIGDARTLAGAGSEKMELACRNKPRERLRLEMVPPPRVIRYQERLEQRHRDDTFES